MYLIDDGDDDDDSGIEMAGGGKGPWGKVESYLRHSRSSLGACVVYVFMGQ